ncbi:transposase [Streptomyces sp. NPDC002265]|uniref:transposase n=1 Tax=Streptomyces sp. NPDC002265 TaxID=3154415 RepID=UPI00331B00DB
MPSTTSTNSSPARAFSPSSTSSTAAMPPRTASTERPSPGASPCSARSATTHKPPSGRASRRRTSRSTGRTAPSRARTASPAHPGNPPWATDIPGCPSSSPRKACRECEDRGKCTGNVDGKGRYILLLPEPQQKIQSQVRNDQKSSNWQRRYAIRAGCKATVSETVHAHGLRHCRYRGLAKTHVQHVLTAAGTNIVRLSDCFRPAPHRLLHYDHPATSSGSARG